MYWLKVGQRAERIINLLCDRVQFVNESAEISRYPVSWFQLLLRFITTSAYSSFTLSQMPHICLPAFFRCYRFFFYSFSVAADSSSTLFQLPQIRLPLFLRCCRFVFNPFIDSYSSSILSLLQIRLTPFSAAAYICFHSFSGAVYLSSTFSPFLTAIDLSFILFLRCCN